MLPPRYAARRFAAKGMMICLFSLLFFSAGLAAAKNPKVAIVTLANYTNSLKAHVQVTNLLRDGLEKLGYEMIDKDSLRDGMRAKRLRMVGEIDSIGATDIATMTGAEILVTGSVDLYLEQDNPEISISLRAYDCRTHKIVWVDNISTTGEDQAGLFGIGRLTDIEALTAKAVKIQLKRMPLLSGPIHRAQNKPSKNDSRLARQGRIAVVRFDNSTESVNADAVITGAMIQEVWRRGFDLVEPGELSRLRSRLALDFQGGISDSTLAILRDEFDVAMVITGTVTRFLPNRGAATDAVPEVEIAVRTIDPAGGEVRSSLSIERDGAATETVFGFGRVSAIGEVARQALSNSWKQLITDWFERMPAVSNSNLDGVQNANK